MWVGVMNSLRGVNMYERQWRDEALGVVWEAMSGLWLWSAATLTYTVRGVGKRE